MGQATSLNLELTKTPLPSLWVLELGWARGSSQARIVTLIKMVMPPI